jgi:hypothetical protein
MFGKGLLCLWQGRTSLINASLVNSTIYHMPMYLLPKTIIKRLDKYRRIFFDKGGV